VTSPCGVAIVGCGLIGRKRARALAGAKLTVCADAELQRAEALAAETPGTAATADWRTAISRRDVHIVVVSTPNDLLTQIAREAVAAGKHVFVEKPAARSAGELDTLIDAAAKHRRLVRVGLNHRYHPAVKRARELFDSGAIGELMHVRGRYGHGGRLDYEREWRADPVRAGGGELIDQGVHLIDLSRWFLGEFTSVVGSAQTSFWPMKVDDNAFLLLKTAREQTAFLHVSCTEWKNLFSFEIFGRDGKLQIDGLGGSYGTERLTLYKMLPQMGPPDTQVWEYPRGDESWAAEIADFLEDIRLDRQPSPGLTDARAALAVVDEIYRR
jgi:predicted dehydrogenase